MVLLAKLEETLVIGGTRFELSANRYPGVVHPQGYRYLQEFRLDPFPVFVYALEGIRIEKSVFMIHGENTSVIEYELASAKNRQVELELRPLIAFRDYHSTTHENAALNRRVEVEQGMATIEPYSGLPSLHFTHNAEEIDAAGDWYRRFEYEAERERGLDFVEDLFNPFTLKFDLSKRRRAALVASTERGRSADRVEGYRQTEIARRSKFTHSMLATSADATGSSAFAEVVRTLVAAADQYFVARGDQKTVIAGYHWFADWGRDTTIALPGLALVTGRPEVAKQILTALARHADRGMLPNRFPDQGEAPEYGSVDATLWFFDAVRALLDYTLDETFVRKNLYDVLADLIQWHIRGTRHGIVVDTDGLLRAGEPGVQLTWMDAKVGDWVVTPRHGKPVEIQALWYNALRIMEDLSARFGDVGIEKVCRELAVLARGSFNQQFWNAGDGCLFDVVDGDRRDASIRPNQILAVSLCHGMLEADRAKQVVDTVERELLTPVGLRSLAASDPRYCPRYEGDPWRRDAAYHQGTVWPWLLGPFITAYLKVNRRSTVARRRAEGWLAAFGPHLAEAGLGHVSEIFDAEPPHHPRGCIAQAWSVAEILRAASEDVLDRRPDRQATGIMPESTSSPFAAGYPRL
jgi:predicted glycogen debranching enzyme